MLPSKRHSSSWRELYWEQCALSADLLHVLSTMLVQGATMPEHDCLSCQRIRAYLEKRGYLKRDTSYDNDPER